MGSSGGSSPGNTGKGIITKAVSAASVSPAGSPSVGNSGFVAAKGTRIAEAVARIPHARSVLLSHGLACVSCGIALVESIEDGCRSHGMDDAEISKIIAELNGPPGDFRPPVRPERALATLTGAAADRLRRMQEAEGKQGWGLRIFAERPEGKASIVYEMDFEQKPDMANDEVCESSGMCVFYSRSISGMVAGIIVDYKESVSGEGFSMRRETQVS